MLRTPLSFAFCKPARLSGDFRVRGVRLMDFCAKSPTFLAIAVGLVIG
jgi:hypothetical protein